MKEYLNLLDCVLNKGVSRDDRTGIGTKSIFGYQMRFNQRWISSRDYKKIHIKSVIYELLWFLRGSTNIKYLQDNGVLDLERMGR